MCFVDAGVELLNYLLFSQGLDFLIYFFFTNAKIPPPSLRESLKKILHPFSISPPSQDTQNLHIFTLLVFWGVLFCLFCLVWFGSLVF